MHRLLCDLDVLAGCPRGENELAATMDKARAIQACECVGARGRLGVVVSCYPLVCRDPPRPNGRPWSHMDCAGGESAPERPVTGVSKPGSRLDSPLVLAAGQAKGRRAPKLKSSKCLLNAAFDLRCRDRVRPPSLPQVQGRFDYSVPCSRPIASTASWFKYRPVRATYWTGACVLPGKASVCRLLFEPQETSLFETHGQRRF